MHVRSVPVRHAIIGRGHKLVHMEAGQAGSVAANPFLCGVKTREIQYPARSWHVQSRFSGTGGQMEAYAILSTLCQCVP